MKVSVLIPYRYESEERHAAFKWIIARYLALWPEYEICVGTNDEIPMSRSAARNDAFSKATGDILIVNDADSFCDRQCLERAVMLMEETDPTWVIPFNVYYNLSEGYTNDIIDGDEGIEYLDPYETDYDFRIDEKRHPPDGSVAGVLVLPRAAWEATGGYDERFRGWGYEDDAQAFLWDKYWAPHDRLRGACYHLWHPPAPDGDFKNPYIEDNYQHLQQIIQER